MDPVNSYTDGFEIIHQLYFDYSVHAAVHNALTKNWNNVTEIVEKCTAIVLGSLEKNKVNNVKANILVTIVQIKSFLDLENSSADDENILENWQQLISAIEELYQLESKAGGEKLKSCLVAVLQMYLQMCTNTTVLSKDEQDAHISESIEKLNKLKHFSKRKKLALTTQSIVEMILEVISKLYERLGTPYVLSVLQSCKDQFVGSEFRKLLADPCLFSVSDLDKQILEFGGDPKINLDAAVAKIKKKFQSDQEVCNFLSRQLNGIGVNTDTSKHCSNSVCIQTKLSTKSVCTQTNCSAKSVQTQTNILLPDATVSSPLNRKKSLNDSSSFDGSSNQLSHPVPSSGKSFTKQRGSFSKFPRKRPHISSSESVSSQESQCSNSSSKRPNTSSRQLVSNRHSPVSDSPTKRPHVSSRERASNRQSPGSNSLRPNESSYSKPRKRSLFQHSDSDDSTDQSESIFSKPIKSLDLQSSLMDFKRSKIKPPSHTKGLRGKWTKQEEDELIKYTLKIGEGRWLQIKCAMKSLRSSQQLKDKWRNIPEDRKRNSREENGCS